MISAESENESAALAANDIRVLVSQLNESIQRAAAKGMEIEIDASVVLQVKGGVMHFPEVTVRILAPVR